MWPPRSSAATVCTFGQGQGTGDVEQSLLHRAVIQRRHGGAKSATHAKYGPLRTRTRAASRNHRLDVLHTRQTSLVCGGWLRHP